ncbi:hypothetical protein AB9E14_23370 [Rhizobium leguminosarum]|uniref:hypothetical protein n=1 Tax=Rhizobium leguminosarum TaxID=384 RepID=UPI003F99EB02
MASDIVERLQKAADDFEGIRAYSANDINSDCEPHWSDQVDMADASKAVLDAIAHIEAQDLRIAETRAAALEEAAKVADAAKDMRERLFQENSASINASKAVQAEEIAAAIRALIAPVDKDRGNRG